MTAIHNASHHWGFIFLIGQSWQVQVTPPPPLSLSLSLSPPWPPCSQRIHTLPFVSAQSKQAATEGMKGVNEGKMGLMQEYFHIFILKLSYFFLRGLFAHIFQAWWQVWGRHVTIRDIRRENIIVYKWCYTITWKDDTRQRVAESHRSSSQCVRSFLVAPEI